MTSISLYNDVALSGFTSSLSLLLHALFKIKTIKRLAIKSTSVFFLLIAAGLSFSKLQALHHSDVNLKKTKLNKKTGSQGMPNVKEIFILL